MGFTANKLAKAKELAPEAIEVMLLAAYESIAPDGDPDGPIDALIPWEFAGFFVHACNVVAGGTVSGEYVRGGKCHITCRGRRAAALKGMTQQEMLNVVS